MDMMVNIEPLSAALRLKHQKTWWLIPNKHQKWWFTWFHQQKTLIPTSWSSHLFCWWNHGETMWNHTFLQALAPPFPTVPTSWFCCCRLSNLLSRSSICASTTALSRASSAWYTAISCSCSWKFLVCQGAPVKFWKQQIYKNRGPTKEIATCLEKKTVVINWNQNLT